MNVMDHNHIDAAIMSRFVGLPVSRHDFTLAEDLQRPLAPGVIWRRRRFRFQVEEPGKDARPEALCINEVTLDSDAAAELRPALAAEFPELQDLSEVENAYWATTFAKGAIRQANAPNAREPRLYAQTSELLYGQDKTRKAAMLAALRGVQSETAFREGQIDQLEGFDATFVPQGDAAKFGVVRYLPAFPPSRLIQSDEKLVAGTNAGFFLNFPEEYEDGVSALHQPVGGHFINGQLVAPPWIGRPGIMRLTNKTLLSRVFGPEDMVLRIEGLAPVPLRTGNFTDHPHGMVWRTFDADAIPAPTGVVQVSFTGALLVGIKPHGEAVRPPLGGGTVWLTGPHADAALKPGAALRIKVQLRSFTEGAPDFLVSAGPFLVRNSIAITPEHMLTAQHAGEFRPLGPAPTRFPFDASTTKAPRTALGTTSAGGQKIVVVDGRRSGEHSCGVTLEGLAHLMQRVGCDHAINLDGGGSSVMAIEGAMASDALRENIPRHIVNIPSDDGCRERIVPILMVVRALA